MPEDDQPQPVVKLTPAEERTKKLHILAMNLRYMKEREEGAKVNRIAVEDMIVELIPGKGIGQVTETLPDGSKIVVKRGLNYKADLSAIGAVLVQNADDELPVPIESKTTHKLDVRGYEWYRENHPEIFQRMTEYVTVTPKKVAVELKDPKGE